MHRLYVTVPAGTADLAAEELEACGVRRSEGRARRRRIRRHARAGLSRVSLVASREPRAAADRRVPRARRPKPCTTACARSTGARTSAWTARLAVDCTSGRSAITHTQFAALKVKDADRRSVPRATGMRPSVDVAAPDVRVNLHLDRDVATLAIDLAGESLHRRGYRGAQGAAPLKENLAAAMLLRSGWPKIVAAADDGEVGFVDPMCGSGTLCDRGRVDRGRRRAGSAARTSSVSSRWRGHDEALWQQLLTEAAERRAAARARAARDPRLRSRPRRRARGARQRGGQAFAKQLLAERRELADLPAAPAPRGLLAVNPPYGERLGESAKLASRLRAARRQAARGYVGWQAAVLTGNPPLGLRARAQGEAHAHDIQRPDRMPPAAVRHRAEALRAETRAGGAAGVRRPRPRGSARARRCSRTGCARTSSRSAPGRRKAGHRVLSRLRRRHARVRVLDRHLSASASPDAQRFAYVQEYAPPATIEPEKARVAARRRSGDSRGARCAA